MNRGKVGAMGHFPCDFEDLANDVESVFLRFFVDQAREKKDIPNFLPSVRASCYGTDCTGFGQ